jgi:hypothetical protein
MALVHFFDLPAAGGWMIAGFLGFVAATAVTFILYGMRHAAVMTDPADPVLPTRSDLPANAPNSNADTQRRRQLSMKSSPSPRG